MSVVFVMAGSAAEVACPSNLFPSPTGSYRNKSTANVIYGATVQIALQQCSQADRSTKPPTGTTSATYICGTTSHFRVVSGGSTTPVFATVPVDMTFQLTPSAMGVSGVFDLEVLAMTATGLPGGLMIRESPTLASTGHHTIRQVPSGNYYIDSFFDVFTEISADGGMTWTPGNAAMHFELSEPDLLVAMENQLPPAGKSVKVPGKIEYPNLVQVGDLQLQSDGKYITSLPLRGTLYQTTEDGRATGQVSVDGGVTFASFECDYTVTKKMMGAPKIGEATLLHTELVSLDLSGGTLPAGLRIRESPTKASLGRASSRRATDGLYRIGGFFDIFTECSLNNGATWSASAEAVHAQYNPKEVGIDKRVMAASSASPPLKSYFANGDIPDQEDLVEYPDGTIIRRFGFSMLSDKITPPALGAPPVDASLACRVSMEVSSDGGLSFEPFALPATTTLRVSTSVAGTGSSPSIYDLEMLALNATGTLGSGLPLMLRESPTRVSTGRTTVQPTPDGRFLIGSFFDIFTELSLDSGASWSAARKNRCYESQKDSDVINATAVFPPPGGVLDCDDGDDIRTPDGVVLRRVMIHKIHNGSNLPPPGDSKIFPFTTIASGELSTDGGETFREWVGACDGSIGLTSLLDDGAARYFDTELLALNLSGAGLGSVRVRESPTKASLGRTVSRTTNQSSFGTLVRVSAFIDVSMDDGATWTPASGPPVAFALKPPPEEHFYSSVCVPVCGDSVGDEPVEVMASTLLYRLRKRPELLYQAWDDDIRDRVIPITGTLEGDISTDGGATTTHFQTTYTETLLVNTDRSDGSLITECRDFACAIVSGGATIQIRESPSLPSMGRATKRQCMFNLGLKGRTSGYMVQSFVDMFIEVSTDGLIWSPRSNVWRLDVQPVPAQDNAFATDFFPPRDGSFDAEPGAPPVVYSSSTVIKNVRVRLNELQGRSQPPPTNSTPVTQTTPVIIEGDLSLDGGATWSSVSGAATCTLHVTRLASDPAQPVDLSITVEGLSSTLGTVMVRESPTKASTGRTTIHTKTAGLNVSGNLIDSFFDIFTEISLNGGATWLPANEAWRVSCNRVGLEVTCNGTWSPQAHATHRAVDPDYVLHFEGTDATLSGLVIGPATTIEPDGPAPAALSGEVNKRTCSCPTGYYISSTAAAPPRRQLSFGWVLWTEQNRSSSSTQLDTDIELSGLNLTTDVPGLLVRESPTRASIGRTSLRTVPASFALQSFFDVFLELSLDGGQTWHAALTPLKMEAIDATRPKRFGIGSTDPLPPVGFTAATPDIAPRTATGDKPTQVEFWALIDSLVHVVDDRQLIGLREYDAAIQYQVGDTTVINRARGNLTFGYICWKDPVVGLERTSHAIEVTQFDLSGGTLTGGMKLRESPSLPSRGRCERITQTDGSVSISSFFDIFTEISHDNGATWSACDLPLHFVQDERAFSSLTHSDQFVPQGINYIQSPTPVRCPDGSCAATLCDFTSPSAPLPNTPGVAQPFALNGRLTSSFTRAGASSVPVSADVSADVNLTLVETTGSTRYFDAEVLSLTLTGAVSPAEFRLRESPTRQSLGRHCVTDLGGGNFRIASFFDIFTEISVDGGSTWSECDAPMRLELGGPELDVKLEPSIDLAAGTSTIDFGYLLSGGIATRNVLLSNQGNAVISDFGMSRIGSNADDFSLAPPSTTTLAPGASLTVPVTFTAGTAGTRTATLRITSNDSDESPFDITLTARALAPGGDDDGDGLTNQQEVNLTTNPVYSAPTNIGLNPLHGDDDRLAFFRDNGLFLASDVHALNLDVPLLEKLPGTNQFKLTFGLQRSTDRATFQPFPMLPAQTIINGDGKMEFQFSAPEPAAFFRVQAR